jgi:hypothetical protein
MNAREYYLSIADDRNAWRDIFTQCMWCSHNRTWVSVSRGAHELDIHEIERRSHAPRSWGVRCNYLRLCRECHQGMFASLDHAHQLAVKLVADPDHFDLDAWLRIRDPELTAPNRVTLSDIAQYLRL